VPAEAFWENLNKPTSDMKNVINTGFLQACKYKVEIV
jgi:hypothetical protein